MLNQLVLVGRLVKKPELKESENKAKYAYITLAVPRSFKNINGEYDTDFVDCILWDAAATNTVEYCDKGDIIGIRGRIQTRYIEKPKEKNKDVQKEKVVEIICERVTFLSTRKSDEDIDEIDNVEQEETDE